MITYWPLEWVIRFAAGFWNRTRGGMIAPTGVKTLHSSGDPAMVIQRPVAHIAVACTPDIDASDPARPGYQRANLAPSKPCMCQPGCAISKNCYWGEIDSFDGDGLPNDCNCRSFVPFAVFPVCLFSIFGKRFSLCARIPVACVTDDETSHICLFRYCYWID